MENGLTSSQNHLASGVLQMITPGVVPPYHAPKLLAWAHSNIWRVAGINFVDIKSASEFADQRETAREVYDAYRKAHHILTTYVPQNVTIVRDALAVKLNCENFAALEQHDNTLAWKVSNDVVGFIWRKDFLFNQKISDAEMPLVINTIAKHTIKIEGYFTALQQERLEQRKKSHRLARGTDTKTYNKDDLKDAILNFLRLPDQQIEEHTSAEIAALLGCRSQWQQVGRLLGELARETGSGVVYFKKHGDQKVMLWKYAPWRREMKVSLEKSDAVMRKWVMLYVTDKDQHEASKRSLQAIRNVMRKLFGPIGNRVVDKAVQSLVADSSLVEEKAFRRGKAYCVATQK